MGARNPSFKPVLAAAALALAGLSMSPVWAQQAGLGPAQQADAVAPLFEALRDADAERTRELAAEIRAHWSRSGSAAIDLLIERGREALAAGDTEAAIEHLTAAMDHSPDLAEAHVLRANAYYLVGLAGPALVDLRAALEIEPRHFGAIEGFAAMFEQMDRPEAAREAWQRVLALKPQDAQAGAAALRLDIMLGGRTL